VKRSVRFWVFSLLAVVTLVLAACGGGTQTAPAAKPKAPAASSGSSEGASSSGGSSAAAGGVTLELGIKGEELAFDKDKLTAKAAKGDKITLKFTNTSKTQQHNFTLLNSDSMDNATKFNDAAMTAVDTKYYPEDKKELTAMVVAHVSTKDPGQSESITFDSPGPGKYLYICTVPGHFAAGDYGTLTIN